MPSTHFKRFDLKNSPRLNLLLAFTIKSLLLTLLFLIPFFNLHADDISDLQAKIDERNRNISKLEQEIKEYSTQVDKTTAQAKTLANSIKALQLTGKKLDTDIKLTQVKISSTNLTITKISKDIDTKEKQLKRTRDALGESINQLNQSESVSIISYFLSTKSIGAVWKGVQELFNIQGEFRAHAEDLKTISAELEKTKDLNEAKKNELKEFESKLTDQKTVVIENQKEKDTLLKETKNQEAAYQSIIQEKAAKKAAFEKELFNFESQLKFKLDPKSIPQAGSFPFSWPTDNVYITQYFGKTAAAGRLYVSGSHNGVDFKALMGTPIKAVLSGTVVDTGDTDITCPRASFGRWVLIRHTNGLSTIYAHLSIIKVTQGQNVSTGEIIAYSGNTGYSTGPHLHISVYASDAVSVKDLPSASCGGKTYHMPIAATNAYLDPMLYFPVYKK